MKKWMIIEPGILGDLDTYYPPAYDTKEEAEKELKKLNDNPKCDIFFTIKEIYQ